MERTIIPNPRAVAVTWDLKGQLSFVPVVTIRGVCALLVKLGDAAIGRERVFRAERSPDLCVCVYCFGVIRTSFPRNQGLTLAERGGLTMHARQKLIPLKLPLSTMSSMTCGSTNISSSIKKKNPPFFCSDPSPLPSEKLETRLFEFLGARFPTSDGSRVEGDGAEKVVRAREEQQRKQERGDRVARKFCAEGVDERRGQLFWDAISG